MHAFVFHPLSRAFVALTVATAVALPLSVMAQEQHAHVHGKLSLDVAVDDKTITVTLNSPLDNFLGFERAPRTDEERTQVSKLQKQFKMAHEVLSPDPAAECRLGTVTFHAPVLGWGQANEEHDHNHDDDDHDHDHGHDHASHANIEVRVTFTCAKAAQAKFVDVKLFDAYTRIRSMDAQIASPTGQFKRSLRPDAARLSLTR